MGLPDEIHGVPVASFLPRVLPAPFPEPPLCPSRDGRPETPPSPGLLVLYLPYAVVVSIRHIEIAG